MRYFSDVVTAETWRPWLIELDLVAAGCAVLAVLSSRRLRSRWSRAWSVISATVSTIVVAGSAAWVIALGFKSETWVRELPGASRRMRSLGVRVPESIALVSIGTGASQGLAGRYANRGRPSRRNSDN